MIINAGEKAMSKDLTQPLPNDNSARILQLLTSIDTRVTSLDTRLSSLEEKVDRRLQETRPIWEQVLARVEKLEIGVAAIRADVATIQVNVAAIQSNAQEFRDETDRHFETLKLQMEVLTEDVIPVRAGHKNLILRGRKLKSEVPQ